MLRSYFDECQKNTFHFLTLANLPQINIDSFLHTPSDVKDKWDCAWQNQQNDLCTQLSIQIRLGICLVSGSEFCLNEKARYGNCVPKLTNLSFDRLYICQTTYCLSFDNNLSFGELVSSTCLYKIWMCIMQCSKKSTRPLISASCCRMSKNFASVNYQIHHSIWHIWWCRTSDTCHHSWHGWVNNIYD